jgi:hypothetical protein
MSCVACSIKDLSAYQTHLDSLESTTFVLSQSVYAATCVQIYLELLKGHGITSYKRDFVNVLAMEAIGRCCIWMISL